MSYSSPRQLIDAILSTLLTNEENRLTRWLDEIVQSNSEAYHEIRHGFLYEGDAYRPSDFVGAKAIQMRMPFGRIKQVLPQTVPLRIIHPDLEPTIQAYRKDRAMIDDDRQLMSQTLFRLIDPCSTQQDIRDALPDCLTDTLGSAAKLPRRNEPAFTIADDPRAMKQYLKALPKLQSYSAARLLF